MTQTSPHSKKFTGLIWFVVLVVIIVVIAVIASKKNDDVEIIEDDVATTTTTTTTSERDIVLDARIPYRTAVLPSADSSDDIDTVEVSAQKAGDTVHLTKVVLTNSGWVAIHERATDGTLGAILGAARFDTGIWQGEVVLLRTTVSGRQYNAVVYHDDGDKEFDFKKDIVVMRDGAPVMTAFTAQ